MNKIKSIAFTLAETLIVMGIIGVVSALVVPMVKDNSNEHVNVAKAKKLYSELVSAYEQATIKYGHPGDWGGSDSTFANRLQEYLNADVSSNKLTLKDGATVVVTYHSDTDYELLLDVDGPKKGTNAPADGEDQFYASVNLTDLVNIPKLDPFKYCYDTISTSTNPNSNNFLYWVVLFGNQDYIDSTCKSTLTWNNKITCK